jgi:hypothetical protein
VTEDVFDQVQKKLALNRNRRLGTTRATPICCGPW